MRMIFGDQAYKVTVSVASDSPYPVTLKVEQPDRVEEETFMPDREGLDRLDMALVEVCTETALHEGLFRQSVLATVKAYVNAQTGDDLEERG